jgi:cell division protein FtsL
MRRVPLKETEVSLKNGHVQQIPRRLLLMFLCGLFLTCGFVYAARQHFLAIEYGYMTEDLRKEEARLLEEQRRLLLEREQAASPARIEKAARALGMKPLSSAQVDKKRTVKMETPHSTPTLISSLQ